LKTLRPLLPLATLVLALGAAGCGGGGGDGEVPEDAVAVVGDSTITKDEFDRWFDNLVKAEGEAQVALDPPKFTRCVAEMEERSVADTPTPLELCREEFAEKRLEVMPFLIRSEWVRQMTDELDVEVDEDEAIRIAFPEGGYEEHLRTTKLSKEDALFQIETDALGKALQRRVVESDVAVSDDEVEAFYSENEELYAGQSLKEATPAIRSQLFTEDLNEELRGRTSCRKGYVVDMCGNSPKDASEIDELPAPWAPPAVRLAKGAARAPNA
jgi:hypothetical protein